MPGKPFQSKLVPYTDFIRNCRTQGMSYPRIAAELRSRFGLQTASSNVFSFVKVRARRCRETYTLPDASALARFEPVRWTIGVP